MLFIIFLKGINGELLLTNWKQCLNTYAWVHNK